MDEPKLAEYDDVEITPEMIEAGVTAIADSYCPHSEQDDWEDVAQAVYRAMERTRQAVH